MGSETQNRLHAAALIRRLRDFGKQFNDRLCLDAADTLELSFIRENALVQECNDLNRELKQLRDAISERPPMKPTTGPYSIKLYKCCRCGHEAKIGTNHWGETYGPCTNCQWKFPREFSSTHKCLEPVPEGYGVPEKWQHVKLGDIAEIK